MAKISWKYLSFLALLVGLYFVLLYFMPQRFNWFVTLYQKDKNPFGTLVLKSLMDNSWNSEVYITNKTMYELSDLEDHNLLILCENLEITPADRSSLLNQVSDGKTAIISTHQLDSVFADTLGIKLNTLSFSFYLDKIWGEDSLGLKYNITSFDTSNIYWLPEQLLPQYFEEYNAAQSKVLASNTNGKPVLLDIEFGDGNIILSSTPLAFTNFSMLRSNNYKYVEGIFSGLQEGSLCWAEYYQMGRMEAQTPLRYILSEPSLKWALYLLMITIVISMIFEIKRKQRVIPVVVPLKNETLDFVKTIARLYYQKKDHKNLAAKKILHFTDYLKRHLHIDTNDEMVEVIKKVAGKSGTEEKDVRVLFEQISKVSNSSYITSKELKLLLYRIETIIKK